MRRKKTKKKALLIILGFFGLAILSFFLFSAFSKAGLNFSGFGWVGNDLAGGVNTGEPATGWLSFSYGQTSCGGPAYAVTLGGNQGDNTRPVSGYAWFGIGSASDPYSANLSGLTCQNDAESLGWVNFQAGSPPFCPGECHSAEWHRTGNDYQGYIDGWAKVVSMGDDGWMRLKGSNYGLSLQQDGLADGNSYGWNADSDNSHPVGNNAGLGWIKFANAEICSIAFPSATQTISETANSLSLIRNRAAGFPVSVNLSTDNPSRLSFPTNPVTFPAGQTSYNFPISITDIPNNMCTDSAAATEQSICGQSSVALTILQNCSVKCSPEDVTIMPGETVTFTADVQGYSDPSIGWSYSGNDSDCVKSATANGATYTVEIYITTPGGKDCAMKSFRVTAVSSCASCGSGTCGLDVSRPGWIETNP